jgi:hypothetical protein
MKKTPITTIIFFLLCFLLSSCAALVLVESFEDESKTDGWSKRTEDYSPYIYNANNVVFELYAASRRVIERNGPFMLPIFPTGKADIDFYRFYIELYVQTDSQNIFIQSKDMRIILNQADTLWPTSIQESGYKDSTGKYDPILKRNWLLKRYGKSFGFKYDIPYAKMERIQITFADVYLRDSLIKLPPLRLVKHRHREYYPMTCH